MRSAFSRSLPRFFFSAHSPAAGPEVIEPFLSHGQLQDMFERIGSSYDFQNHLLSMWRDRKWRSILVDAVQAPPDALICDMAVGTGDVAIPLARHYPSARVVGFDNSPRMLERAKKKIAAAGLQKRVSLERSDIRATRLDAAAADVITSAFTLRNLPDRPTVLAEFHRLLKPGGRLFILELGIPPRGPARLVYQPYFDHFMPFLGNLLSRTDYAYSYLRESVHAFPGPDDFVGELRTAGFRRPRAVPLSYGTAVLYICTRGG